MANILDKFGKSSIDTDYAIATTVKTTRVISATVLEAYDLSKFASGTPVFFVTYKKTTDPVTGDVNTTNQVSWKALVNTGANTLTNLTLAPGYVDSGNAVGDFIECVPTSFWENNLVDGLFVGHNPDGSFKKSALQASLGNDGNLVQSLDEVVGDFVQSGGIWSLVSGLNGAMTALTAYINGYRNTVALVTTRAFTPLKDTYVDILRNTTTNVFSLVYTEVANAAAAPALAANSLRLAKIVTNGTTITLFVQYGFDSLFNPIYPYSPIFSKEAWIAPTFQNNWVSFGSGFADATYMKDSLGFVHMEGMVKSGTANTTIFTLPVGYRPSANLYLSSVTPNGMGVINVAPTGTVTMDGGNNSYMSLSNVRFRAEG